MESESEFGNIEYKRTISHIDVDKLISYAAQMKYRVKQSNKNIAYYYIGINDDGTIYGLDDTDVNIMEIFKKIVDYAKCKIDDWWTIKDKNGLEFLKIVISENSDIMESRILITGKKDNGKSTFIAHCIYQSATKSLVTRYNSSSIVNCYPFGHVTENKMIYNYGNCDDINEIKLLSDQLIYLVNVPNEYKYLDKINFDQLITLHFTKERPTNYNSNTIYMIQNDGVDDFILTNNICQYNNYLSYDKLNKFLNHILTNYNNVIKKTFFCDMHHITNTYEYIIIVDVLYSYSNKQFLLLVLSKIKNKNNNKINSLYDIDNNKCTIKSIQLEGTECQTINQYNRTYTIIVEFNTNVYKLKGKKLFFEKLNIEC